MGDHDPVHTAVEDGERGIPLARHESLQGGMDAVERLAERLAAEEALGFVGDPQRSHERALELLGRDRVEPATAPLGELRPALDLVAGRDELRGLGRAREVARDDEVELDPGQGLAGRDRLRPAGLGQRDLLGADRSAGVVDVRHLGVPHQVEPPPHASAARTCSTRSSTEPVTVT